MTHLDIMIKEKCNNNVLGIKYFYQLFAKRKYLFPTLYFPFPINTQKKKLSVSIILYRKIIQKYLDIYFNEFYYKDQPKYFMLSGFIIKGRSRPFTINLKNGNFKKIKGIAWIWYERPSIAYYSNIKLVKLTGSTNRVDKLDKNYKAENDFELLAGTKNLLDRIKQEYKFFKT